MTTIPPEVFQHIRRIQITTNRLAEDIMVGAYHSAFKGKGMEFEEVREFTEGDSVRNIDWNVTARTNQPYVKNFREERELTVMLMVDISASSKFGTSKLLKSELIAEISALLAFTAIKNNDNVGLLLFSDIVEEYIPPKKGLRHVLRVIRDLLVFEPKHRGSNLKVALDYLGNIQKKSCVCFIISDFLYPIHKQELGIACKRHDLISIHILDSAEESFPDIGLVNMMDLETGKMMLVDTAHEQTQKQHENKITDKKNAIKETMKKLGAGYILIKTDESYVHPLRRFFRLRRIKH
jgi:uncharacterized protein (DUF58 family)